MACQPAPAPLPWAAQAQTTEPDMHPITVQQRRCTILRKQRDLFATLPALVERLDRLAPGGALAVVDLAQIKHVPLHCPAAANPAVLHDAPIAVLFAVLAADLVAQKHDASLPKPLAVSQDPWSAPQPVSADARRLTAHYSWSNRHPAVAIFPKPRGSCESRVNDDRCTTFENVREVLLIAKCDAMRAARVRAEIRRGSDPELCDTF